MFGGFFIARVITAYVNEHKKIFALCFGTGSGDAHPHEETAFSGTAQSKLNGRIIPIHGDTLAATSEEWQKDRHED
jgi:hypothetical protein